MKIRAALETEIDLIVSMRKNAALWLRSIGSDQWSDAGLTDETFTQRVSDSISRHETWMTCADSGEILGTIAIDQITDAGLWNTEQRKNAVFLHRMIIDRNYAGRGVGQVMLDWAHVIAVVQDKQWLRLDAWTTNRGLHRYYERNGFHHVRTVQGHKSASATLFERGVMPSVDASIAAKVQRVKAPLTALQQAYQSDQAEPWSQPEIG